MATVASQDPPKTGGWGSKKKASGGWGSKKAAEASTNGGGWGSKKKSPMEPNNNLEEPLLPKSAVPQLNFVEDHHEKDGDVKPFGILAVITTLPALLGSWCWPLLIAGLFSSASALNTGRTRALTHTITLAINFALFTNMLQFMYPKCKRDSSFISFLLVFLGMLFVLEDELRHCLLDAGYDSFSGVSLAMYGEDGGLTTVGRVGQICTWVGVLLLLGGIWKHLN